MRTQSAAARTACAWTGASPGPSHPSRSVVRPTVAFITPPPPACRCKPAASAVAADGAAPAPAGTSIDDWKGLTVLKGGRGYVQAPLKKLHYRDVRPRNRCR